ncbi:MAG: hypothetical protein CSA65_09765 [Proteobacteria bacterium]|nr:MAG: hypothetical protein CSB49_06405 [Pseudomonadota bacterium]PIE17071.1 MAG: hypothetical protein CSA65_09765 [Pseudomonadota bacterium]
MRALRQLTIAGSVVGLCAVALTVGARKGGRSVLYPRPPATLRFSHRGAHAKLACARCHAGVARSISANDRHVPREGVCRPCHQKQTRAHELEALPRDAKAAKRCATCHIGYRGGAAPARLRLPAARLRFSHRIHASRGVACARCHDFGGEKGEREQPMPTMASCLSCHNKRKATQRCAACHLSTKSGKLRTRFGTAKLRPKGTLIGAAHTPLFKRKGHARLARLQPRNCQQCHPKRHCLRCHAGTYKPLTIHRSDYVTHHAMDARLNTPRCQSCHRSQTFCRSCHRRSGVGPGSRHGGFRPSTGRTFHPKGFASQRVGPGHHSYAARRNMRACVSCHGEKSCIRCHGTLAKKKGGFSPHPRGFGKTTQCRALRRRNPRVCLKCHRAGDPKLRCF